MKPVLIARSLRALLLGAMVALGAPESGSVARPCCSAADDHAASEAGENQTSTLHQCRPHGALDLPDSPTGRMAHAFIDLTYTNDPESLRSFVEGNFSPGARQRNGDESLRQALETLRRDLVEGTVRSATKTSADSAEVVVASGRTGFVATLSLDLEPDAPHRIDRLSARPGEPGQTCAAAGPATEDPGNPRVVLPSLAKSLSPLIQSFNADKDKLRFVALLSPSCGGCLRGAQAIQKSILEDFPGTDISVHIVWLPMLGSDTEAAAKTSSLMFDDPRVHQYYDPERSSGWAYTNDVFPDRSERMSSALPADHRLKRGIRPGERAPAWDIYMLYKPGIQWTDSVPVPTSWVMQTIPGYTLIWKNDFARAPFRSELVDEIRILMDEALAESTERHARKR